MSTSSPTICTETARHVLWRYDRTGGTQPGPFTDHLIAAIEHADHRNRAILRDAYPELSEAIRMARYDEDGLGKLQSIAVGTPIRCKRCRDEDGPFTDEQLCEPCARPMPLDGVA